MKILRLPAFGRLLRRGLSGLGCACVITAFGSEPSGAITITQGEYQNGVVVVEGELQQPNQMVTLDNRFTEWSDRLGHFTFSVPYAPADCMVRIEAGQTVRPVYLANCGAAAQEVGQNTVGTTSRTEQADGPAEDGSLGPLSLRSVRQPCERNKECLVVCRKDEVAVNAFCPDGDAKLLSQQSVSCGAAATTYIVGYCLAPQSAVRSAR